MAEANTPAQLMIEKMMSNPNYRVTIAGLGGTNKGMVKGFLQDDLKFSGGNRYNNPFESEDQQKLSDMATKAQPVIGAVGKKLGFDVPSGQFSLKSFDQTIESWTGSQKPAFSLKLTFLALGPHDDVTKPVKQIMRAVMPTGNKIMLAPLGYGPVITTSGGIPGLSVKGTLAVQVGKWFRAVGQICKKAAPSFSKEVIESGQPLYATVEFDFEPYRMITYSEFVGYFIGSSN